ncbi:MAG: DNA replication and repair protein RecF [Anaerolineae bacterium]|nr:DNA replication and repair protein RecF [Anaerolineae bacterium]
MYIRSLSLRQFRTFNRLELDLPAGPVLLLGANAQGKTSLLESIAYMATGQSPLTNIDQHLIHWHAVEADMPFAYLKARIVHADRDEEVEIALERHSTTNGHTRTAKRIKIDQRAVRKADLAGHFNVVLFLPEDLVLVSGSPEGRRRHLDDLLSQISSEYVLASTSYRTAVSRRNALLRHLRENGGDRRQLEPLDKILARDGVFITLARRRLVDALNRYADRLHQDLTGGTAWLQLQYQPSFDTVQPPAHNHELDILGAATDSSEATAGYIRDYRETLLSYRNRELVRGVTMFGPHRDEMRFTSNSVDLGIYGSRGQQRTAVLALRFAALRWLEHTSGESPVLLLDEVLAELDQERRTYLLDLLGEVEQTILATTDAELFPARFRRQAAVYQVAQGIITPFSGNTP